MYPFNFDSSIMYMGNYASETSYLMYRYMAVGMMDNVHWTCHFSNGSQDLAKEVGCSEGEMPLLLLLMMR